MISFFGVVEVDPGEREEEVEVAANFRSDLHERGESSALTKSRREKGW
jgi:hypothetical protein